jgi:hypothetical protein
MRCWKEPTLRIKYSSVAMHWLGHYKLWMPPPPVENCIHFGNVDRILIFMEFSVKLNWILNISFFSHDVLEKGVKRKWCLLKYDLYVGFCNIHISMKRVVVKYSTISVIQPCTSLTRPIIRCQTGVHDLVQVSTGSRGWLVFSGTWQTDLFFNINYILYILIILYIPIQ